MRKLIYLVILITAIAVLIFSAVSWYNSRQSLPRVIRIAGGRSDGLYYPVAQQLAKSLSKLTGQSVHVIETNGSEANLDLLSKGKAELGFIQTVSSTPQGILGIAPLFEEPMHLLVRKDKGIRSVSDLVGKRVTFGPLGSGSRQNALTMLDHYQVPLKNLHDTKKYFGAIATDPNIDAALFTTGWMNPTLEQLFQRNDLELVGISDAEGFAASHPWFVATTIPRGLYSGNPPVPTESI